MKYKLQRFSRRDLLAAGSACAAGFFIATACSSAEADAAELDFPLADLHVHLDNSSLEQVMPLSKQRGVRFGIVEHAGTRENKYPRVLSTDEELKSYIAGLSQADVFKGVQAEWIDWSKCFSRAALAQLDYTLGDAMTFPGKNGERVKLWEKDAEQRVDMSNRAAFMDRYADWHVEVIATQPLDILANVTWLPEKWMGDYDALWTEKHFQKIIDAAVKHRVTLEISASYQIPHLKMLRMAKDAGGKFSMGSNGRYPKMGLLDYSVATAKKLGLRKQDMFVPAPDGQKAVQRRTL